MSMRLAKYLLNVCLDKHDTGFEIYILKIPLGYAFKM